MSSMCRLGQIISDLDDSAKAAMKAVLSDRSVGAERLRFILAKHDIRCGVTTIKSHRAGVCNCFI